MRYPDLPVGGGPPKGQTSQRLLLADRNRRTHPLQLPRLQNFPRKARLSLQAPSGIQRQSHQLRHWSGMQAKRDGHDLREIAPASFLHADHSQ